MKNNNRSKLSNLAVRRYSGQAVWYLIIAIILTGCIPFTQADSSSAQIPIQSLMINVKAFPQGWSKISYQENDDDASLYDIGNGVVSFQYKTYHNELATHEVLRFVSPDDAESEFNRRLQRDANIGTHYFRPSEISYKSNVARRTSIQCFHVESEAGKDIIRCNAYAQYGSYFSGFFCSIGAEMLSYADFKHILQEIDKSMVIRAIALEMIYFK